VRKHGQPQGVRLLIFLHLIHLTLLTPILTYDIMYLDEKQEYLNNGGYQDEENNQVIGKNNQPHERV
jgi:hypothetical protein